MPPSECWRNTGLTPVPDEFGCKRLATLPHAELRVQARGRLFRVLYTFDPKRVAILLTGGDKTGHERWYEVHVPIADKLYDRHIEELKRQPRKKGPCNG